MFTPTFSASPLALFSSLRQHHRLIWQMAKRDAWGRYKGTALGVVWSLVTPLLMLAIYTFVFTEIFKARWAAPISSTLPQEASKIEFALILYCGLVIYQLFSDCVSRAPNLIISHANYVKKLVFPLELLPVIQLISSAIHALIGLIVLLAFQLLFTGNLPFTALLIPIVFLPLMLLVLGMSWLLCSLGVFMRDIGQTVGIVVTGLMFLSPIFYPASALPLAWQHVMDLNPLVYPIETARQLLIFGQLPDWGRGAVALIYAVAIAWIGFAWFQKTRKGFADVL